MVKSAKVAFSVAKDALEKAADGLAGAAGSLGNAVASGLQTIANLLAAVLNDTAREAALDAVVLLDLTVVELGFDHAVVGYQGVLTDAERVNDLLVERCDSHIAVELAALVHKAGGVGLLGTTGAHRLH